MEYSKENDAAYCLYCYLFKPTIGEQAGGDCFVVQGFKNWKKNEKFRIYVGKINSAHNQARRMCEALQNQEQHVETFFNKQSNQARNDYRMHLNASIECTRYLLRQELSFCGHYEYEVSRNRGNFLELLQWLSNNNEKVNKLYYKKLPQISN